MTILLKNVVKPSDQHFLPSFQAGVLTGKLLMRYERLLGGQVSGYFLDILELRIYTYT